MTGAEPGQPAVRPRTSSDGPSGSRWGPTSSVVAGRASTSPTRPRAARTLVQVWAASASGSRISCRAIGVRTSTASWMAGRVPSATAGAPMSRPPITANPTANTCRNPDNPRTRDARSSAAVSRSLIRSTRASASSCSPYATRSGVVLLRLASASASSPRSGETEASARREASRAIHGTTPPASTALIPRTRPAPGDSHPISRVAPTATTPAEAKGTRTRTTASITRRTSSTIRTSRSPDRRPSRVVRLSVSYTRSRSALCIRSANSWPTSRSAYRKTPRPIPKARTEVIATIRYRTGGCSAARDSSQAEAAIRPTDAPEAIAASSTVNATRPRPRGTERSNESISPRAEPRDRLIPAPPVRNRR